MSKVLGFMKKDGRFNNGHRKDVIFVDDWIVGEHKLVPVCLKSESVELAALERKIGEIVGCGDYFKRKTFGEQGCGCILCENANELLVWARGRAKEAEKNG